LQKVFVLLCMDMKKKTYECLICGWKGNNPLEVEVMTVGEEGTYKVCPECYWSGEVVTEALIVNLEIYTFDE